MTGTPAMLGRYEILERVGKGSMGIVYRGRDTTLDREVAIKVMSAEFTAEEGARARFFREARAAARLQHRNIVTVFEFAEHDGKPYIVMEFLHGCSLAARMKQGPPLEVAAKLDIVAQLCAGLDFAHREGIVHRDVKPANVWLCTDGTVKLLDFGIAKYVSSAITRSGEVLGSPYYMSPEQISGRELDGRADVFSAGVLLYELLAARKPFEAESPTAVLMKIVREVPAPLEQYAPDLPQPLLASVARALEKDPAKRYAQASEFAADLRLVRIAVEAGGEAAGGPTLAETLADTLAETLRADLFFRAGSRRDDSGGTDAEAALAGEVAISHVSAPAFDVRKRRRSMPWIAAAVAAVAVVALAGVVALRRAETARRPLEPLVAPARTPDVGAAPVPQPAAHTEPTVLKISSDPEGAAVWTDAVDTRQVTPVELPIRPDGLPGRVRLMKRGYKTVERALTADLLRGGTLSVTLEAVDPIPAVIEFSGPYDFEILDGAKVISAASSSHRLTLSGRRALRLRAAEYFLDQPVAVDPARARNVNLRAPALGRLTIRTSLETCTVEVGGRAVGYPPIVDLPIVAGRHTVVLKCPSGPGRQTTVSVAAGQVTVEIIR